MGDLKILLKKLENELILLYEYTKRSPNYPIEFQSSLELLNENNRPPEKKMKSTSNQNAFIKYKNFQKFQPNNLVKNNDKTYTYRPLNIIYPTIFHCIKELTQQFSVEELLAAFSWQEFEEFITSALNHYGYHAFRTFRYTIKKKRHEVDVIARERYDILFIDTKRWNSKTANESALIGAAENQYIRAMNLVQNPSISGKLLQKLHFPINQTFKSFRIYPIILVSSKLNKNFIVNGISILDFSRFNEFLNNFQSIRNSLKYVKLSKVIFQKKFF